MLAGNGKAERLQGGDSDSMARIEPQYDRETINRAGARFRDIFKAGEPVTARDIVDLNQALDVINNWRSSHAYPLNAIVMTLRNTAKRFDSNALVAQRIKRLASIGLKLVRFERMKLSQMQDLGGCRAILQKTLQVSELADFYKKVSRQKHEIATEDDYILNPKESGYRGIHLVFKYHSDDRSNQQYSGLKIEMQLRSRYQHAWATAVETVGLFSGQALKSSLGSEEWQRFFTLMASAIAMRERMPLVPNVPQRRAKLLAELADMESKLKVGERLRHYRKAVRTMERAVQSDASYFLLQLDPSKGELNITGYRSDKMLEASAKYAEAEQAVARDPSLDAVLVSVESINNLSRAYPNYFADTRIFLQLMEQALSGHSRGIAVPALQITPVPMSTVTPLVGSVGANAPMMTSPLTGTAIQAPIAPVGTSGVTKN